MRVNLKNKISKLFIIILMILSALLACNVLAQELNGQIENSIEYGKFIIRSEHIHNYPVGSYIPFSDLNNYYDLFCCQLGTNLPHIEETEFTANGVTYSFPYLTMADIGMRIGTVTTSNGSPFSGPYTHNTIGNYKIVTHHRATPEEAYVLSEMITAAGDTDVYNSILQLSWWNTEAGNHGNVVDGRITDLYLEAKAFEDYIKQLWKNTKTTQLVEADCKYTTAKFKDIDTGEVYEVPNAFDIEYKPEWNYEGDCADPTVMYDQTLQVYTVGPFAIDYIGGTVQFGGREPVQFAGITGMELYTDASDEPLILGTDWEIIYAETVRHNDIESEFPQSGEEFYIKLNYIDGATQITNIKVHFRYMNAAGEYDDLQGKYFVATWQQDSKNNKDEDGDVVSTTYWLELTDLEEHDSRELALGLNGARWYQYTDLDRSIGIKCKSIKILKEVVDKNGEKIESDDFFDFKIDVSGAINSGSDKLRVRANKTVTSATYYWMEGKNTPTYTVEEIPTDGYELVSIENATGTLDSNEPIIVKAINTSTEIYTGKIQITKEIQKSTLDSSKFSFVGQLFKFKVIVSGTFEYEGQKYENKSIELYPEVIAVLEGEAGNPWVSSDFTWYGEEAPEFTVEEIEVPEGAELLSITPTAGVLSRDNTVEVTALNKHLEEQAAIEIIKRLENSDYLSEEEIKALEFYFTIHVDGYDDVEVIAKASREEVDGGYEWVWRGDKAPNYTWLYGNDPAYTITEHDNPEGTSLVSASSDSGDVSLGGSVVSGTLVADKDKQFIVKNTLINKYEYESNKGDLELTKVINDSERLKNRDYSFVVTLNGKFRFEGESEELLKTERTIQFTNDSYVEIVNGEPKQGTYVTIHIDSGLSNTWSTAALGKGQIEWYGNNRPAYTVEEDLAGSRGEYVTYHTVTPSTGNLSRNETIKVKAENYGSEEKLISGRIRIIKTLENAEKYDASYINSLVFKFRVEVNGYDAYTVKLKADRVADKFVWEYLSDEFYWKDGEAAPTYTIEEIDLPKGTELVSAQGLDGSSASGTKITGTLKASENSDVLICTENSFINKLKQIHEGKIAIKKIVTHDSLNGEAFKYTLKIKGTFTYDGEEVVNGEKVIEDISVTGGNTWTSGIIKWDGENAPQYSVTEAESEIAKLINVINGSGRVTEGNVNVTFINEPIQLLGRIKVHKTIKDQPANSSDKFTFKISVGDQKPFEVAIKADETYTSQPFTWYATEEAPTYKVEEINLPKGAKFVSLSNEAGSLDQNDAITVEAVNQYDVHRGKFILEKVVVEDKTELEKLPTFQFNVSVTGEFSLSGDESTTNTVWTHSPSITGNGTYESPEFVWYGDEAPVVHVEELSVEDGLWKLLGISNNDAALSENDTLRIVATNQYNPGIIIELTFEMGGTVWNDAPLTNDKNMEGSTPNGKLDDGESGIEGVEVYVYIAGTDELATIYADSSKNEIVQPLITAGDGKWSAPRVPVLKDGTYDIKFVYDGQTFEPTTPLVTGSAEAYKGSSNTGTSGRAAWLNDSMADDVNREEVNGRLTEIKGNSPIDGAGNTVGKAVGSDGSEANILYEKSSGENESRIASKAITLDKNGRVLDLYKAEARTSQVGLTYPFDQRMHLESFDIIPSELGVNYRYLYSATYPYTLHINLGLVKREIADVDAIKDLVEAKVVVNERLLTYKFNKLSDVGKDVLTREAYLNGTDGNSNMEYQLGFYQTDYYYRAEIYKSSRVYDHMQDFYKSIGQTIDATNLEVYLKYRISVYNESPNYQVTINEVADYFDSAFGEPIKEEVKKYVQTIDGKETNANELETVAKESYLEPSGTTINWNIKEQNIKGSDGITYNKMTTDVLKGMKLASGEKAEMFVYFKVQPTTVEGITNTIELASKSNVVEISNYSTYNSDGSIAGKIDVDSAPDNVNIRDYNEKAYYEDDADSAPILQLKLYTENAERTISGYAWEDKPENDQDNNTVIGNGLYDEGDEALIGGLTTELVEKIKVPQNGGYAEYDFLWPTNENLACLGGRTVEELTGFDSTTETGREVGDGEGSRVGSYEFTGIPVGNYIVRFMYGNDKSELDDTFAITGDPVALKADSSKFASDENILVANYDEDIYKTTAAVYNGQDFKSTLYQAHNGEEKTEWHNLKDYTDYNTDSDFVENEARRLESMANTTVITNVNGTVLATANNYSTLEGNNPANYDASANHAELYRNTYMIADSGKINFNLENIEINGENSAMKNYEIETVEVANEDGSVKVIAYERTNAYEINDVAFGLIRRAETNVVLDKEITRIKLTTNDNRVIFDAEYDVDYKVESLSSRELADKVIVADLGRKLFRNKYLVADVNLSKVNSIGTDVMQSLDKAENKLTNDEQFGTGTQNFRFVNIDDTILQGTTIEIGYKLTALNVGETDTVSPRLANIATEEILDEEGNVLSTASKIKLLAQEVENESKTFSSNPQDVKTLDLGKYVGRAFYTGDTSNDEIVTTRVRQVVDYVDTDGTFATSNNDTTDHSWRNTTINELLGNGYESDRLIETSLLVEHDSTDKNGIKYITDQRNNIVLSIDNYDTTDELNNSGFERILYPYTIANNDESRDYKSSIDLTITKTVSATDDADNLAYDNIAEIVKFENTGARRDEATIPGNANPEVEQFAEALQERDQSATELVTFTPPTGLEVQSGMTTQILIITVIALGVLAIGIVIIKKTVLK